MLYAGPFFLGRLCRFFFQSRSSSRPRCSREGCGSRASRFHPTCPQHSPCLEETVYDPSKCTDCLPWLQEVSQSQSGGQTRGWQRLSDHFRNVRRSVRSFDRRAEVSWADQSLSDLFDQTSSSKGECLLLSLCSLYLGLYSILWCIFASGRYSFSILGFFLF